MDLSYILNHLGEERQNYFGSVTPPVIHSSNFAFSTVAEFREALQNEFKIPLYSRGANPTLSILRKKLAALEHADDALLFSSGSAAISAVVLPLVEAGDHVICVDKPYTWTKILFTEFLPKFNVHCTFVDGTDVENFRKALQPNTKIVFLETPNSMKFDLQDIEQVSAIAKEAGAVTIVDNSYSSPLFQQPLLLGADVVVHSATKYIGGHSDAVAGVVCTKHQFIEKIFRFGFMMLGGILPPHDAWLLLRSLRTLEIRMKRIDESVRKVVQFLEQHSKVERVFHPFASGFPQKELAERQMSGAGGLFSILLRYDSMTQIEQFCNRLKRFILAVSWGGHESLLFPLCATHVLSEENEDKLPYNLVRIYVGLEDPQLLIDDLEQALSE